jgi:hypothetical protein
MKQLITNFTEEVIVLKANPSRFSLIIGESSEREIVQIFNIIATIVSVMSIMRTRAIESSKAMILFLILMKKLFNSVN